MAGTHSGEKQPLHFAVLTVSLGLPYGRTAGFPVHGIFRLSAVSLGRGHTASYLLLFVALRMMSLWQPSESPQLVRVEDVAYM